MSPCHQILPHPSQPLRTKNDRYYHLTFSDALCLGDSFLPARLLHQARRDQESANPCFCLFCRHLAVLTSFRAQNTEDTSRVGVSLRFGNPGNARNEDRPRTTRRSLSCKRSASSYEKVEFWFGAKKSGGCVNFFEKKKISIFS